MAEPIVTASEDVMPAEVGVKNKENDDVNILLMGPSGVGKTTFINAIANYIKFDSLELAVAGEMEVLIPSSFPLSGTGVDAEFEDQTVTIGNEDQYENFSAQGQSATQSCRSFVFRIGDRILRLIDTPGVADSRGIEQDAMNVQNMLAFVSQYDHLNAICILLKPNEERLTVPFQYCVKELLRHLHITAKENLMFLFTNARSNFYRPGKTKKLLETMFEEHNKKYHVNIPITTKNTFLFDNEAFRYLAIRKQGIELDEYQRESYVRSWGQSVKECVNLLKYTIQLPKHYVQRMISLNAAQQLVQKLPRPVAEISKLIEENIQMAKNFEHRVEENSSALAEGLPQNTAQVHQFTHPRTVCASKKCIRVVDNNGEKKIEYTSICHDNCYLKGVIQERLKHPNLADCEEMHYRTGKCLRCGCHWTEHIHITYQLVADRTYYRAPVKYAETTTDSKSALTLDDVRRRIEDLTQESQQIRDVYKQLVQFLQANAMLPVNDGLNEYLNYFIREEQTKDNTQGKNSNLIAKLEQIKNDHAAHVNELQRILKERPNNDDFNSILKPKEIVDLVTTLYALPINGSLIREQVEKIQTIETETNCRKEHHVTTVAQENSPFALTEMMKVLSVS